MSRDHDSTSRPPLAPKSEEEVIAAALRQELSPVGARPAERRLPEKIGTYAIIRRIGAGGMGVVYEAEQAEPKRRVALKVARLPAGAEFYQVRHFQREIQVLGRFRHPSIAQIYDAGHTEDGQQYFVMELVDGEPLTEYCELHELSLQARLDLFGRVCEAVQYAHRRGVIHRDLKPSNILVDDGGVPHILDFGLSRFVDPDMEVTRSILDGQALVGTLPYMSPEQTVVEAVDLDVRTDVYSLGVILYEMLTGEYPYPVAGQLADVLRNIAESEPARPSSIHRKINDEVETIVLRALAKERDRRYQSAEALGQDVRRYLDGEPIEAKRDSALYVIRKLLARHAYATGILGCVVLIFLSSGWIALDARHQSLLAQAEAKYRTEVVKDRQAFELQAQQSMRRMAFGWFLADWRLGISGWPTQVRAMLPRDSPEYAAMTFLLDGSVPEDRLLATLTPDSTAFAHFAIGERRAVAGHTLEAIEAFEASRKAGGGEWLQAEAQARLEQLRAQVSQARSSFESE